MRCCSPRRGRDHVPRLGCHGVLITVQLHQKTAEGRGGPGVSLPGVPCPSKRPSLGQGCIRRGTVGVDGSVTHGRCCAPLTGGRVWGNRNRGPGEWGSPRMSLGPPGPWRRLSYLPSRVVGYKMAVLGASGEGLEGPPGSTCISLCSVHAVARTEPW